MKQHPTLLTLILLVVLTGGIVLTGCTGDDGPPGQDGTIPDNIPPSIFLVTPTAGDTLNDTLRIIANAEDNVGIKKVVFFLDGSDARNDTGVVHLYEPPYQYTWDLIGLGVEDGPHIVMGRAYDLDGNVTDTPPVIVYSQRIISTGKAVLYHYSDQDSMTVFVFPQRNGEDVPFEVDSLWTRFSTERVCSVDSVAIYLDSLETSTMNYDTQLLVSIYASNGVYPTEVLASSAIDANDLAATGFYEAIFTPAPTFGAGEKFHVLLTVLEPSDTTLFGIRTAVIDRYTFATDSRSGTWVDDQLRPAHWETMQEQMSGSYTKEFYVRAMVTYE